jgi:hypothetical protein
LLQFGVQQWFKIVALWHHYGDQSVWSESACQITTNWWHTVSVTKINTVVAVITFS